MDLLNLDDKQFSNTQRESFIDPDLYYIDPAKGQQGVYKSIGRFVPWWKNPNTSKLRKNTVVMTNPLSKDKLVVDCPSSKPNTPSILWDLDKMLKDREANKLDVEMTKEIREYFNRFLTFHSPFYIFKDPQVPALENTIKILNFGITFDKLIQKELNPEDAELNPNAIKINPYSLTAGKDFLTVVKKKSKRFKDYDGCKFIETVTPFRFVLNNAQHVVTVEELQTLATGAETPIGKFLQENTPNLEKYAFREWTEDTYKQVAVFLKAIIPYAGFMRELIEYTRDEKMKQLMISITAGTPSGQGTIQTPANTAPATVNATIPAPVQTPAPTVAAPVTEAQTVATPVIETPTPVQTPAPAVTQPAATQAAPVVLNGDNEFDKMLKDL